jgi:hypothetical protein
LADVAAQRADRGQVADALLIVRLAEEDERTTLPVRCMLHGVRARLHAMLGERDHCLRQIGLVHEFGAPEAAPEWMGGWVFAHVQAVCGHAFARLAEVSDSSADAAEAHALLAAAADELMVAGRLRAAALCLTSLARMHVRCGNPDEAGWCVDRAKPLAEDLRSARVARSLAAAQARTASVEGQPRLQQRDGRGARGDANERIRAGVAIIGGSRALAAVIAQKPDGR